MAEERRFREAVEAEVEKRLNASTALNSRRAEKDAEVRADEAHKAAVLRHP